MLHCHFNNLNNTKLNFMLKYNKYIIFFIRYPNA